MLIEARIRYSFQKAESAKPGLTVFCGRNCILSSFKVCSSKHGFVICGIVWSQISPGKTFWSMAGGVFVKSVPTLLRRTVIYQMTYSGCDRTYTGQTGRLLETRLQRHRGSHNIARIRAHLQLAGHPYPWICQPPDGT